MNTIGEASATEANIPKEKKKEKKGKERKEKKRS